MHHEALEDSTCGVCRLSRSPCCVLDSQTLCPSMKQTILLSPSDSLSHSLFFAPCVRSLLLLLFRSVRTECLNVTSVGRSLRCLQSRNQLGPTSLFPVIQNEVQVIYCCISTVYLLLYWLSDHLWVHCLQRAIVSATHKSSHLSPFRDPLRFQLINPKGNL